MLAEALTSGALESVVIGLSGELGAGKTEWVRGFMAALGRAEEVCSPTFAIVQVYEGEPPVRHLDLYRLHSPEDLEAIGYRELIYAPGITLVEWVRSVTGALPDESIEIELAVRPSGLREIRIQSGGERLTSLVKAGFHGAAQS